jgi:hypothetical protein
LPALRQGFKLLHSLLLHLAASAMTAAWGPPSFAKNLSLIQTPSIAPETIFAVITFKGSKDTYLVASYSAPQNHATSAILSCFKAFEENFPATQLKHFVSCDQANECALMLECLLLSACRDLSAAT